MDNVRPTICYVLPFYDPDTDTHISYLYNFLEYAGEYADIHLIVERSLTPRVYMRNMKSITVQKLEFLPLRILENFVLLLGLRLKGCKNFYVHYSYVSALNAALITRAFFGHTFYWNCGMPWLFGKQYALRLVLRVVDYLVTGTTRMAELYSEHFGVPLWKTRVMPNWIDLKSQNAKQKMQNKEELKKKLDIPHDKKVALFVHRLSKRKGAHYLPDIARQLPDDTVLVVVGDGPELRALMLHVTRYKLQDKMLFAGRVPQREIHDYFSVADVFIMPSNEEGFPHVLLEAMASGIPFVASDVGGVKDIVPESFFRFVAGGDILKEFPPLIEELFSKSDEEKNRMRRELSEWVTQYDLPHVAELFVRLF